MTDISSKESLPQLTDVLYLLTDSQELLLLKIQGMRMEYARSTRSAAERTPSTVNATPSTKLELISTDDNAAHAVREKPGPASPSSNVTGPVPVMTVLPLDDLTLSETTTAETATQITAHAAVSDLVDSAPSIPTDSANRSYNFFDDLDERLADLERPDTAS